jgi:hypothetical protein
MARAAAPAPVSDATYAVFGGLGVECRLAITNNGASSADECGVRAARARFPWITGRRTRFTPGGQRRPHDFQWR